MQIEEQVNQAQLQLTLIKQRLTGPVETSRICHCGLVVQASVSSYHGIRSVDDIIAVVIITLGEMKGANCVFFSFFPLLFSRG
jgi:hypothetical protein